MGLAAHTGRQDSREGDQHVPRWPSLRGPCVSSRTSSPPPAGTRGTREMGAEGTEAWKPEIPVRRAALDLVWAEV